MPPVKPLCKPLTEAQQRVYDQLAAFIAERGYAPSMRELADRLGMVSPNAIRTHFLYLEAKGWIKRDSKCARAIVLTRRVEHVGNSIGN